MNEDWNEDYQLVAGKYMIAKFTHWMDHFSSIIHVFIFQKQCFNQYQKNYKCLDLIKIFQFQNVFLMSSIATKLYFFQDTFWVELQK